MTVCALLDRPRLMQLMSERWTRRVITVTAGPGFGKSVLLAQAAKENALAPRGVELTIVCTGRDRWPHHFLGRLAELIDLPVGSSTIDLERMTTELGWRWPMGVSLVIDDVHHLTSTPDGARLVTRLVSDAPPSVHFVLAGRRPVRGLSRLQAMGEVRAIAERDLAFDGEEARRLAHDCGVEPATISAAGGWPAVTALAATYGITGATDYVWEAVLDRLDGQQRRVVAIAATIGRCDPPLLRAAVDDAHLDPVEVLENLPMVENIGGRSFVVHDLWREVVGGELGDDELRAAVTRAIPVLVSRADYDRAFGLCAAFGLWDQTTGILEACCSRGHPDVRPHVLESWLDQLPPHRLDEPDGLLLRGFVSRKRDEFSPATVELLQRATDAHRLAGNVTGEVAATTELVMTLRNQGRCDEVPTYVLRLAELHAAGHRSAAGSVALFRSVLAEMEGDSARMLTELDEIPDGVLNKEWSAAMEFRRATACLTLGDKQGMMRAAARCAELGEGTTMRHVVPLTDWYAGDPRSALRSSAAIVVDAGRSRVDGLALNAFATMVLATSGRLREAEDRLAACERAAQGGAVAPLMQGYLIGIRALLAAASGDDSAAAATLHAAMDETPLDEPVGWMTATRWLALAYVLVPEVRPIIDSRHPEGIHQQRVAVARAVAAAREAAPLDTGVIDAVTPGMLATTVPLPWAMTLASRLAAGGDTRGREFAEWLFDVYGCPARDALRTTAADPDRRLAGGARKLLAAISLAPQRKVLLDVLGPSELRVGAERAGIDWNRERVRSLLLYLVLNGPSRRDQIIDALWPDLDFEAADRNLRVTLTYLHRVLEPDRQRGEAPFFVRQRGNTLALAGEPHLTLDVEAFGALLDRATDADRRGSPSVAVDLLDDALSLWRGDCLADVMYEEWAQPFRRQLDERYVRAAVRAAELNLATGHNDTVRRLARQALAVNSWCEAAHRAVVAAALADGDHCEAARALAECDARLAELGVEASPETDMLRRRLMTPRLAVAVGA